MGVVDLTIHQMIERYSAQVPHHTALIEDDSPYCYGDLNNKANQLAHYLKQFDLKPDDIIAVALDGSAQLIITIVAILKSGCAYLPLDANHPQERLHYILDDTRTPIVITRAKSKDQFNGFKGHLLLLDHIWHEINMLPIENPAVSVNANHLAYVIYTSGSTGQPKGVLVEHMSVVNYINWFSEYSQCRPQDRIDFSSSIIFDMAVTTTITALALGLQVVICNHAIKKNVAQYLLHLQQNKINIIKITPSYFKAFIQEALNQCIPLFDLKTIILGGEILHTKECATWLKAYPKQQLFNEYGPTETTVAVTAYAVNRHNVVALNPIVPIGTPGLNIECLLLDRGMQPVTFGEIGELYVSGQCLARGYQNLPELTEKHFVHLSLTSSSVKWYRTGDLCRILPDGNIEFIKRVDDQIKIRGYRIEPSEISACLITHPSIKDACVIAHQNQSCDHQLIAYYILHDDKNNVSHQSIRNFLQQKLADYMIPAVFMKLIAFPLTTNGKLDKLALPKPIFIKNNKQVHEPLEQQLIKIWEKAFQLNSIGIDHNFFELGGHSLIASRILVEVENQLGKKLHLDSLYKAPTVRELAKVLITAENSTDETLLPVNIINNSVNSLGDFQFIFWLAHFFEPKVKSLNIIARRRFAGWLDKEILRQAFTWVMKKHNILSCQISKVFPIYTKKELPISIQSHDMTISSDTEVHSILLKGLDELINLKLWKNNKPLIAVKLFLLQENISELQISVSHVVFDDASEDILFNELSQAYLYYQKNQSLPSLVHDIQYNNYVHYEQNKLNQQLQRDINFWQAYLQDTNLITIAKDDIIHNMKNVAYSTYFDVSDEWIKNSHRICANTSVSLTELIVAATTLSFKKAVGSVNNNVYINIVRSVRNNDVYDKMIGCFLRLDPIKVNLSTHLNLIELAQSIQESRLITEPFQSCSGMVKLACLDRTYRKKFIQHAFIRIATIVYCRLFRKFKLNPTVLAMYGRLRALRTKNQFLININLLNNFVSPSKNTQLFGYDIEETDTHEYDLSTINNVIDICFLHNASANQTHLVVSGNLRPSFRQRVGAEIIRQISHYQHQG